MSFPAESILTKRKDHPENRILKMTHIYRGKSIMLKKYTIDLCCDFHSQQQ